MGRWEPGAATSGACGLSGSSGAQAVTPTTSAAASRKGDDRETQSRKEAKARSQKGARAKKKAPLVRKQGNAKKTVLARFLSPASPSDSPPLFREQREQREGGEDSKQARQTKEAELSEQGKDGGQGKQGQGRHGSMLGSLRQKTCTFMLGRSQTSQSWASVTKNSPS